MKRFIFGFVLTFCVCLTTEPFAQFSEPQSSVQLLLPIGAKAHLGKGAVFHMQYSPDNKHLVVATGAGIVWIYETETYQSVSVLAGHPGQVVGVEFSSDSKRMLSGVHTEGIAYLWDTQTWQLLYTFRTTSDSALGRFWFSADDTSVMMQNWFDESVDVWDVETGEHIENIPIEDEPLVPSIPDPPFLDDDGTYQGYEHWHRVPNSDLIAAWERDTIFINLFNVNTGEYLYSIICCLIVYPSGSTTLHVSDTFAPEGGSNTLHIFNNPEFSPDGRHVAIAGDDGTVRIFDINNRNTIFTGAVAVIEGHTRHIKSIAFSPDGETLATDSVMATLWDVETQTLLRRVIGSVVGSPGTGMVFSPDGLLALPGGERTVSFIDVDTGLPVRTILAGYDVFFSPDLKIYAEVRDGQIRLVDTDTGRLVHEISAPPTLLTPMTTLGIVNNETGEVDRFVEGGGKPASLSVGAFSPDGQMLAGGALNEGWIFIYDVQTGEQLYFLDPPAWSHSVYVSLAFSPDGRILASGDTKGVIRLWEITSETIRRTIIDESTAPSRTWDETPSHLRTIVPGLIDAVLSLAFSPDGNVLVSGDRSGAIDFWDVESGTHLQTLRGYRSRVIDLAFSPDGNTLASASTDIVLLWEYDPLNFTTQPHDRRDVNDDGVINVLDLVSVARAMRKSGYPIYADVNSDGVINVLDLILVAQNMGEPSDAAAPSLVGINETELNPAIVRAWIAQAELENDGSIAFREGIAKLKSLLALLIPKETALLANYPNPFNPETWIPYQLSKPADVRLTIYALNGQVVRTLALGHQAAGMYQSRNRAAYWDGRNAVGEPVASGVYFYTLTAGDFTATRKMLIRK